MALQLTFYLYRNINSNDDTKVSFVTQYVSDNKMEPVLPPVSNYNWSNGKKVFKEWNTKSDGTGITYQVGDYLSYPGEYDENFGIYAIWEYTAPYDKINWQTGDIITAEKLNYMESGIEKALVPFIVTLTPTAQDHSGTMDKTVAEINAAYEAGRKIVFRVATSATEHMDIDCTYRWYSGLAYPSFNAYLVVNSSIDAFVVIYTDSTDTGTKNTYGTTIYPLTPMS